MFAHLALYFYFISPQNTPPSNLLNAAHKIHKKMNVIMMEGEGNNFQRPKLIFLLLQIQGDR